MEHVRRLSRRSPSGLSVAWFASGVTVRSFPSSARRYFWGDAVGGRIPFSRRYDAAVE
jgi:hypothetical protein